MLCLRPQCLYQIWRITCRPAARAALGPVADPRPRDRDLPTFVDIQSGRTRTLRHVPTAARFLWGRALAQALSAAVHHNDAKAWTELLMLPQCVLGAPPRGGRRHRRAAAAYTVDRLQRWAEGERQSLGRPFQAASPKTWPA